MVRLKGLRADCSPDVLLLLLQQVPHLGGSPGEVLEQVLLLLVQQVSATPEPVFNPFSPAQQKLSEISQIFRITYLA